MTRVNLYPYGICHSKSPALPLISHSNSACGNTIVVQGVLKLTSTYPVYNCLFLRHFTFITLCHCSIHLQQEHQKAIPVLPIKSTKQQSRIKILQCTYIHWLSVKTLRVNPMFSNSTCTKTNLFPL